MKKIIIAIMAVFLTACIPANEPKKIRHAANTVNSDSMINHTAMRLMTDNCFITRIEYNSDDYYTVYAYSESLEKELIILDDMPENVIYRYPINSHIIRLYDHPENVVDIIKRK